MPKREPITLKLDRAAEEFDIDRRTLAKLFSAAEIVPAAGDEYTILQCHRAIAGNLEAEKIRETRHRANILEMEEAEKRKTLGSVVEFESWLEKKISAWKQVILASGLEPEAKEEILRAMQKEAVE